MHWTRRRKRRSGPTGIATYIGTWSGTSEGIIVNGTFEVTVDLDNGTVSGSISGDAVTTLSGTANESGLTLTGTIGGHTLRRRAPILLIIGVAQWNGVIPSFILSRCIHIMLSHVRMKDGWVAALATV